MLGRWPNQACSNANDSYSHLGFFLRRNANANHSYLDSHLNQARSAEASSVIMIIKAKRADYTTGGLKSQVFFSDLSNLLPSWAAHKCKKVLDFYLPEVYNTLRN